MNLRKIFIFFLGFLAGLLIVAVIGSWLLTIRREHRGMKRYDATVPAGSEAGQGSKVFVASSLDRIFQDGKTLLPPLFTSEVTLFAARNEYESFQVVVAAGPESLSAVSLEFSPLVSSTSDRRSIQMDWRIVGFVPTEQPYYPTKYIGPWPDPLLPSTQSGVDKSAGQPVGVDIAPGMFQPFWISVYVPDGTEKGEWRGEVVVKSGGNILKKIPIHVTVWPFELPTGSHLKTAFDFYGHLTHKRYPQKNNESDETYQARISALNQKFLLTMLRYRMNPILNIDPSDNKDLAMVDRFRLLGLNNFSIGKKGGTFNNNWPSKEEDIDALASQYRTYGEMLKLNKLLPYTYIYTWDEGNIGNPVVAKICAMIHRAYPGLKNMVCYHGIWSPEEFPDWGKDIDIWCFQIDNFNEGRMRALQKKGMEMWMYISGPSGYGSPNLALDFDSIDYRVVPWLCWKYDIKGFLYWCVNWWEKGDPFLSARNVKWEQNGNGLLFYPGEDGPVPSLRAEIFRDGMEDYEYVQILLKKLIEIKNKKLVETHREFFEQAKQLLTVDSSIAEGMSKFNKDAAILLKRRADVAKAIVAAEQILNSR